VEVGFIRYIIFLIAINLSASSLMEHYRSSGVNGLIKKAEELLISKEYWLKKMENIDTEFGYYEDLEYLVFVDKSKPSLELYKFENSKLSSLHKSDVIIGKNKGHKVKEGDRKTPTGVYKIVEKKERADLNQFYGPLAFVLSYPNLFDKLKKRTGSGIWIHGMPIKGDRELFTRGCVAFNNDELLQFGTKLEVPKSSLVILSEQEFKVPKEDLALILSSLYKWLDAWRDSDYKTYINFYSENFLRYDGKDIKWFKRYKSRVFRKNEVKEIFFTNINIAPYPNRCQKTLYRVTFDEIYKSKTLFFQGKKELYIEIRKEKMEILVEK
jgi:murein L,D-transpeptidase YafK